MTQKRPTNWQVVGIGVAIGILITNLGFSILQIVTGFFYGGWGGLFILGSIAGIIFSSPWGIAGALIGRYLKNDAPATWDGAVVGTIIGLGTIILALSLAYYFYNKGNFNSHAYFLIPQPGIPFGIIGVMIGKGWKQSSRAMWVGGILGAIVGILLFGWLYLWALFAFGFAVA